MKVLEEQRLKDEKEAKKLKLSSEPSSDMPESVLIKLRLPNGSIVSRRFYSYDTVELIYDYVGSLDDIGLENKSAEVQILTMYPRKIYNQKEHTL